MSEKKQEEFRTLCENPTKRSELFPEGRTLYYEGDDPTAFVAEMKAKFGFDPGGEYSFHCPGHLLDEIYGNGKCPLGS